MPSRPFQSRRLRLVLLGAGCLLAVPAQAEDNRSQITQAQEQLKTEHYADALASALEAVRLKPDDYHGHYYVAMACMVLGRFDEAEAAVVRAEGLAPDNARDAVAKLRAAIATNRQGEDKAAAAEAALADGLLAKAARLYREAWSAKHDKPEPALKAADLYANRLGDPVIAATLLHEVMAAVPGTQAADQAQAQYDKVADTVKKIAREKFEQAKATQVWDDEVRLLAEALAADPANPDIHLWRADLASRGADPAYFRTAIKDLARVGLASDENLLHLTGLPAALGDAQFTDFLADVIGAGNVAHLQTTVAQSRAAAKAEVQRQAAERQAADIRAAAAAAAKRQAEVEKFDLMERQLAENSAAIVSKVEEIKALRTKQWEAFIRMLNQYSIDPEFKVKNKYKTFGWHHFQNHVSIGPNSVTIHGLFIDHYDFYTLVVVTPGHLWVNDLYEQVNDAWVMSISTGGANMCITEIGEPSVPDLPPEQRRGDIWWNGARYTFNNLGNSITAIRALQDRMMALHDEVSSLFRTVQAQQQKLEAAGRKVNRSPVYPPAGPSGGH